MSQPNWRKPLGLATILFLLSGFSYWLVFQHKAEQEDRAETGKKLITLAKAQVHSIRIASERNQITLECEDIAGKTCRPGDNSKWQMTAPLKIKADDNNSHSLVSMLDNVTASDVISLKEETPEKRLALLKEYGLDPESLPKDRQVEVTTDDGKTALYFGLTHPIGDGIFVAVSRDGKLDDSQVYVVPGYFKTSFERDLTYWRDKKVLPLAAHEIDAFTLKNSRGEIRGERKDGMWTLRSKNEEVTGDLEAMDTLLTGATALTAKDFASDDKSDRRAKAALAGAKQVVTFSLKKEKQAQPIVLALYKKTGKSPAKGVVQTRILATVSDLDPVFELDGFAKERLEKTLQELRLAKLITSMDRFSAKRLEFVGSGYGSKPEVLLNKDSRWEVDGAPQLKINAEKVQNFLDHLTATKIEAFESKNLPTPPTSALEFSLGDETQPKKRRYIFWRDVTKMGEKLFAKDLLSSRKEVFLMDNSLSHEIPWDKAQLQ